MSTKKSRFYIQIVADHNDGDYINTFCAISEKDIERIRPLVVAIKNFKPYKVNTNGYSRAHYHNWPEGDYCYRPDLGEKGVEQLYGKVVDNDTFEMFRELVPTHEGNCHSIKTVEIIEVESVTKWL